MPLCALRTDKLVDLARITKQVLPGSVDNAQLRSLIFDYDKRRGSDGFQDGHVGYYLSLIHISEPTRRS